MPVGIKCGPSVGPVVGPECGLPVGTNADLGARLFLVLGQSNANGKDLSSNLTDQSLITPYGSVNVVRYIANNNTDPIPFATFPSTTLQPRTFYPAGWSSGVDGDMGVELTLGRQLVTKGLRAGGITLVMCGIQGAACGDGVTGGGAGGSFLHPNTQYPANPKPPDPANCLLQMIQYVQSIENSLNLPVGGIFWIQGESDAATTGFASAYSANCTTIFNKLRALWPLAPIVISRMSNNMTQTFRSTVQTQQDTLQAATSNSAIVNTDDLAVQGDGAHYTADSYATLGTRLANAMATLTIPATTTAISISPTWTTDATSGKARPQNIYEWRRLVASVGLPTTMVPSCALMMQDSASGGGNDGKLHDSIGGMIYTASTPANVAYGVTITGQSAKGIGWSSLVGSNRIDTVSATFGPNPATASAMRVVRCRINAAPAALSGLYHLDGNNNAWLMVWGQTTGKLVVKYPVGNSSADTANSHATGNMMLIALQYDRTNSACVLYTSLEKLVVTYNSGAVHNTWGIGVPSSFGSKPVDATFDMDLAFVGAAAEMTSGQVKSLFTALGETVSWS